jgi:hypothetical protein
VQCACEEGRQIAWNEAKIHQIEVSSSWWKYKKSAQMAWLGNTISQPYLEISAVCIPLSSNEINECYGIVVNSESFLVLFQHTV